jgi:hypothetical protein
MQQSPSSGLAARPLQSPWVTCARRRDKLQRLWSKFIDCCQLLIVFSRCVDNQLSALFELGDGEIFDLKANLEHTTLTMIVNRLQDQMDSNPRKKSEGRSPDRYTSMTLQEEAVRIAIHQRVPARACKWSNKGNTLCSALLSCFSNVELTNPIFFQVSIDHPNRCSLQSITSGQVAIVGT